MIKKEFVESEVRLSEEALKVCRVFMEEIAELKERQDELNRLMVITASKYANYEYNAGQDLVWLSDDRENGYFVRLNLEALEASNAQRPEDVVEE